MLTLGRSKGSGGGPLVLLRDQNQEGMPERSPNTVTPPIYTRFPAAQGVVPESVLGTGGRGEGESWREADTGETERRHVLRPVERDGPAGGRGARKGILHCAGPKRDYALHVCVQTTALHILARVTRGWADKTTEWPSPI